MSKLDQLKNRRKGHKIRITMVSRKKASVQEEENKLQKNAGKSKNQINLVLIQRTSIYTCAYIYMSDLSN